MSNLVSGDRSVCVHGTTLKDSMVCNYTTQETLIFAGYCMSYNDTTEETVTGECPFSNPRVGAQSFFVTLLNDTSELNNFMCSGLNRTGLLCSQCHKGLGSAVLSYKWQNALINDMQAPIEINRT